MAFYYVVIYVLHPRPWNDLFEYKQLLSLPFYLNEMLKLCFFPHSCDTMTSRKKVLLKVIILGDSGWVSAFQHCALVAWVSVCRFTSALDDYVIWDSSACRTPHLIHLQTACFFIFSVQRYAKHDKELVHPTLTLYSVYCHPHLVQNPSCVLVCSSKPRHWFL